MVVILLVISNITAIIAVNILLKQDILLHFVLILTVPVLNFLQDLLLKKLQSVAFLAQQGLVAPQFRGIIVFLGSMQPKLPLETIPTNTK
jgi:hypothetical protein